jgi:uncharacterized membrane protein HdeD (DUF308 family)
MCIWADKVVDTIVKAIGAVCVVYAVFNLVQYLRTENRSNKDLPLLITAIALAIAGVFLIVQSGLVNSIVTIIIWRTYYANQHLPLTRCTQHEGKE